MGMTVGTAGEGVTLGAKVTDGIAGGGRKNIDARQLTLGFNKESYVDDKRRNARNQAMKIIGDAWDSDNEKSRKITTLEEERAGLAEKKIEYQSRLSYIDTSREQLKDEYGVEDGSQEQQDLELLVKYQRNKSGTAYEDFSEDEISRLKELQDTPLTDYQKKALELESTRNGITNDIRDIDIKLEAVNANALQAKNTQASSQDMLDAKETAQQVLDAAEKDIVQNVVDEAKEAVDDRREESEEKAEEAKEKKEEQEELTSRQQDENDDESIIKGESAIDELEMNAKVQSRSVDNVAEAQKQIEALIKKNSLVNEDIKGIEIDLNF